MFIEFIGKTTKAPEERHRRWLPGTCRSSGACPLFPGKLYKHVAPTVLKQFFNRLLNAKCKMRESGKAERPACRAETHREHRGPRLTPHPLPPPSTFPLPTFSHITGRGVGSLHGPRPRPFTPAMRNHARVPGAGREGSELTIDTLWEPAGLQRLS